MPKRYLTDPQGQRHEVLEGETPHDTYLRIQTPAQASPQVAPQQPPTAPQMFSLPDRIASARPPGPEGSDTPFQDAVHGIAKSPLAREAFSMALGTGAGMLVGGPLGAAIGASSRIARIPGALRAVQGISRLPQWAKNVGQGVVEGAVSAAPFAREGERLESMGVGGALGGVVGAAVPGGIHAIKGAYHGARGLIDPVYAAKVAGAETAESASTPASRAILDSPEGLVADVNQNLAASTARDAPQDVQEALFTGPKSSIGERQARASARGRETLEATVPAKTEDALGEIQALREAEEIKLYDRAYEQPVPAATNKAFNKHRGKDDFVDAQNAGARAMRNLYGPDVNPGVNTVESMHRTLEALTDKHAKLVKNDQGGLAHTVNKIRHSVKETMESTIPGFKAAQQYAKGTFDREDAYKKGLNILHKEAAPGVRNTVSHLKAYVKSLKDDPEQLEFYRRGVVDRLSEGVQDSGVEDNVVRLFNHNGTRDKLEARAIKI